MSTHTPDRFSLEELAALCELPARTVRYYIQRGLVDRPVGETRAAHYTQRHLEQLLTVRKWTRAGLSLDRVRELLAGPVPEVPPRPRGPGTVEVWSHLVVDDGVELAIEPGRAGLRPEQVRALFVGVTRLMAEIRNEEEDGGSGNGRD